MRMLVAHSATPEIVMKVYEKSVRNCGNRKHEEKYRKKNSKRFRSIEVDSAVQKKRIEDDY